MLTPQTDDQPASAQIVSAARAWPQYTHYIYSRKHLPEPSLAEARTTGLSALFEAGPMNGTSLHALRSKFGQSYAGSVPPPLIVDYDYNRGLPYRSGTFDLIVEQGSLKWNTLGQVSGQTPRRDAPEEYVRFLLNEVVRVLRVGGTAFLSLGQTRQNGLDWPWNSSAAIGHRTNVVVAHAGSEAPNHTADQARWLAQRRTVQHTMPIEFAVAEVDIEEPPACSPPAYVVPACQQRQERASRTSCIVSYLFGTASIGALFVHKFAPTAGRGCVGTALNLTLVKLMLKRIPGTLEEESSEERQRIVDVLRARRDHAAATRVSDRHGALEERGYLDSVLTGVRLWLRDAVSCHLPVGSARGCRGAPRISWAGLHVFAPDVTEDAARALRQGCHGWHRSRNQGPRMRNGVRICLK